MINLQFDIQNEFQCNFYETSLCLPSVSVCLHSSSNSMGVPEKVQRMREKSGTGRNLSSVNFFPAVLLNLVTRSPDAGIGAEKLGTDSYRDKRCPKRVQDARGKKLGRNCSMVRSRCEIESGWKRAAQIRSPEVQHQRNLNEMGE